MVYPKLSDEQAWAARVAWLEHDRSRNAAAASLGLSIGTFEGHLAVAQERWGLPIPENARRRKTPAPPPLSKPKYQVRADGSVVGPDGKPAGEEPWRHIERERRYSAQQGDLSEGMTLRGVSTMIGEDGVDRLSWVKTKPQGRPVEETFQLHRGEIVSVSTLYDQQGHVSAQWVKERPTDSANDATIKEAIAQYLADYPPIVVPVGPSKFDDDVIPWFQIGDAHIGMLAHEAETGANFDLKIAERELCQAFATLFDECPARARCVINDLGDATHTENMAAVTEASRHPLDVDGRFPKMIGVYVRIMRFIIDRALEKFDIVDVIINQGNHSRTNDIFMAELLRQVYSGTGRVNVLENTSAFILYRMGNVSVMIHHGDKTRPERLAQVMANDFRQDWGETEYRYIDVGHLHHKWSSRESAGCVIEMWNTLAGKDRWSADSGYRAMQSITRVDRSKKYGEVGRRVLPIREIRDALVKAYGDSVYVPPERRGVFVA